MPPIQPFTPPADWFNHGKDELICKPAGWTSIAGFFISNFVAHAFTVKRYPAQTWSESTVAALVALCYPSFGASRALQALFCAAKLPAVFNSYSMSQRKSRDDLERARDAGALCMVLRTTEWEPEHGDLIRDVLDPEKISTEENHLAGESDHAPAPNPFTKSRKDIDDKNADDKIELETVSQPNTDGDENGHRLEAAGTPIKRLLLKFSVKIPPWVNQPSLMMDDKIKKVKARARTIHGAYYLPKGYEFAIVPIDADVGLPSIGPTLGHLDTEGLGNDRDPSNETPKIEIATSNSWLTSVVALYQIVSGSVSLYQARGSQIDIFGYSAFGLTVVPYVAMTIINLLVQIFTDDYPALYMVHTAEMKEAISRRGVFEGVVGCIELSSYQPAASHGDPVEIGVVLQNDQPLLPYSNLVVEKGPDCLTARAPDGEMTWLSRYRDNKGTSRAGDSLVGTSASLAQSELIITVPCCSAYRTHANVRFNAYNNPFLDGASIGSSVSLYLFPGIVLGIIGGLTHFKAGSDSTSVQRGLTMTWIVLGSVGGAALDLLLRIFAPGDQDLSTRPGALVMRYSFLLISYGWPAIAGMVIAGKEMQQYGSCIKI